MGYTVFVDETKQRHYVMVACAVADGDRRLVQRGVADLLLPGLRELHMSKESRPRQKLISSTVARLPLRASVYVARQYFDERAARRACLEAITDDAAALGAQRMVFDRDDSRDLADNRVLFARTLALGRRDVLRYEHGKGHEERLLALPDAVAWCWAKGDSWRARVSRWSSPCGRCDLVRGATQRETRLANRPDGCRVHFPPLSATDRDTIARGGRVSGLSTEFMDQTATQVVRQPDQTAAH